MSNVLKGFPMRKNIEQYVRHSFILHLISEQEKIDRYVLPGGTHCLCRTKII